MADTITAKLLREQQGPLAHRIRELADRIGEEAREFNTEEQTEWEKVNHEYDALGRRLVFVDRAESVESAMAAPAGDARIGREDVHVTYRSAGGDGTALATREQQHLALASWFRYQLGYDLDERHEDACRATGMRPERPNLDLRLSDGGNYRQLQRAFQSRHPSMAAHYAAQDFQAALTVSPGAGGGYTIPAETLVRTLEINMLAFGGLLQVADTITTASGEPLAWPTADDTTNKGRRLAASAAVTTTTDPTFAQVIWYAYKYSSDAILVPFELLEDSVFDLPNVLGEMLGERLGRILNQECTTGTGAAQPKGIVTAATTFAAASATAIAGDDLLKLVHSVNPAYRGGAGFMLHDDILLQVRLLKDGNSQYLWQSGIQQGIPDRLLSYPLTINQDMDATMAAAKKTVLFGQLSKYKVRRVRGVRFYRLQERYRDNDQDGFLSLIRADGNLLSAGQAPIKVLLH